MQPLYLLYIYAILIPNWGILFYSTVFSSSERDAAYVIDGLQHNVGVKSDIHSTDTEGYTELVFALSHLIKTSFAPRIKNLGTQYLVSFDKQDANYSPYAKTLFLRKFISSFIEAILAATNNLYLMAK